MSNEISATELILDNGTFGNLGENQSPEQLYQDLISRVRKYHPSDDISTIEKAYEIASKAHENQFRKSGEPYIIHPLSVAIILAELQLDKETIIAGILHDVVEDTTLTEEELEKEFGHDVAVIVDGVTKLEKIQYNGDKLEYQAENLRKMFLAMAKDIRVIMVKLADRLHNMRTLQYQSPAKQVEIARETIDIYAPLAQRLGISKVKVELDDLALRYLEPDVYFDLAEKINIRKSERERMIQEIVDDVAKHIRNAGIDATLDGRVKHFFSIYKKMRNQDKSLDQIYDLFAVRIIVKSIPDCYAALGVIHEMYKPIPGRFKDYIAMPKPNRYQSLHTTLIGPSGRPFEIQIRTYDMHRTAEYGIAAHWKYKENSDGKKVEESEAEKMSWLRQILDWQVSLSDNKEFLNTLKSDLELYSDTVYCFTPTGDVKTLPAGSNPIDFAYSVHSAVGNKMIGARVNGQLVSINYQIQNGDRVEILTSQNSRGPSRDWLNIVKSNQAKSKINQWFKNELKDDNIARGRDLLLAYCRQKGLDPAKIIAPKYQNLIMEKYGFRDWDSVRAAVGHGGLREGQIINRMQEQYEKDHPKIMTNEEVIHEVNENAENKRLKVKSSGGVAIQGSMNLSVRFSKCCGPVPGDEIVGYVTRGRGVSIHRTDCVNILVLPEDERVRLIEAEWENEERIAGAAFEAEIKVFASDRAGLIMDISKCMTERNINILNLNHRTSKHGTATVSMSFTISDKDELHDIIEKMRNIPSVIDVERTSG